MSPSWVTFAFEAANFLLLMAALAWLFFRPVRAALERRRSELEGERRAAAEALRKAEEERKQASERRARDEAELAALRERLRREAESEKAALLDTARDQMQRERSRLDEELHAARQAQTRAATRDAAFAARAIVERLLVAFEGPVLDELLLRSACHDLEQLRSAGGLAPLVVEAPAALPDDRLARVAAAAGLAVTEVGHRVDPELVAGVRVLTARGLVDASVAGISAQAERLLVSHIDGENQRHG